MAEDVSILSEIDNLQQFWERHGKALIGFCVLAVLATAGSVLWKNHVLAEHQQATALLAKAASAEQDSKNDVAIGYYTQVEGDGDALAQIAGLRHAALLVSMNQQDKALELYRSIADGKLGDTRTLRDFANLQIMILNSNRSLNAAAGSKKGPVVITGGNGVFFSSEAEVGALSALRAGDTKTAETILNDVVTNESAPYSQRLRDSELQDAIKGIKK
jgi:hypothetical protein